MATATQPKYYLGTGRRKSSVARVRMCEGDGKLQINKRPLDEFFKEVIDRNAVLAPLKETQLLGKVNVYVTVHGGGMTGQSGAICQGLARALKVMYTPTEPLVADEEGGEPPVPPMIKKLRDANLLTRDSRMKERKKYGHKGARKSFQFSKR